MSQRDFGGDFIDISSSSIVIFNWEFPGTDYVQGFSKIMQKQIQSDFLV